MWEGKEKGRLLSHAVLVVCPSGSSSFGLVDLLVSESGKVAQFGISCSIEAWFGLIFAEFSCSKSQPV